VSTPERYIPARSNAIDARLVRDVAAIAAMLAGAIALIYAGFLVSDAAGWATFGVLALAAGLALGYDRDSSR
jgi:fatty acid desaturase